MIEVINIKYAPVGWKNDPRYVYIGRAGHGLGGEFGNPIALSKGNKRGSTLDLYRAYLEDRLKEDETFANKVKSLDGKVLVCFCKPERCHGDILAEYSRRLNNVC
jgi:hypothetical protein